MIIYDLAWPSCRDFLGSTQNWSKVRLMIWVTLATLAMHIQVLPSGYLTYPWYRWPICSWFTYEKWPINMTYWCIYMVKKSKTKHPNSVEESVHKKPALLFKIHRPAGCFFWHERTPCESRGETEEPGRVVAVFREWGLLEKPWLVGGFKQPWRFQ